MTATDAIWTQGGSFTAAEDRALISALTGARHFTDLAPGISKVDAGGGHGVVGAADLAVTPGAGHSVDVAAGQAFVRGTQSAGQGTYLLGNDATLNLAISTPDATNDRIDIVQIRVSDDSAGAGVNTIDVKAGTPAGSPSAPTPDENCLVLAEVLVPASAASSANYTITDRRTRAAALGGILICTSSTRPNPAHEGLTIYERDTDRYYTYTGSTWQWAGGKVPRLKLRRASNQGITNGGAGDPISWDTEVSDPDSQWAVGSNPTRIPLYLAGQWRIKWTLSSAGTQTTGIRVSYSRKSGAAYTDQSDGRTATPAHGTLPMSVGDSVVYDSNGSDYAEIYLYQNEGSTQNWKGWVEATYEGPI